MERRIVGGRDIGVGERKKGKMKRKEEPRDRQ